MKTKTKRLGLDEPIRWDIEVDGTVQAHTYSAEGATRASLSAQACHPNSKVEIRAVCK